MSGGSMTGVLRLCSAGIGNYPMAVPNSRPMP